MSASTRAMLVSPLLVAALVAVTRGDVGAPPAHEISARIEQVTSASLDLYANWLGERLPDEDRALAGVAIPWRSADAAMQIESVVAYELARRYWIEDATEPAVARGLSWYLQSRAIEHVFNLRYAVPGHSTEAVPLLGGHVAWPLPSLRIDRWSSLTPGESSQVPDSLTASAVRAALGFATLERHLSWPVLQGGLAELAARRDVPLTSAQVDAVISAAAGQDLTWLFDLAFNPEQQVAYHLGPVEATTAENCQDPCHRTRVVVTRLGNAAFTGSSQPRLGPFEAGAAVAVDVRFDDGSTVRAHWDGRDERRVFEFASASPASVVRLDPDGKLLLDSNRLDHVRRREPGTNVPVAKWLARWTTWLQHALLTYAMLV